jgi:transposase
MSDLFGVGGQKLLTGVELAPAARARVNSALRLIETLDFEVELFAKLAAGRLRAHGGYRAIQQIPGVGPVLGAVFVAEIGDITRFDRAARLASWAGLTPKHHESDTTVHRRVVKRGRITKQGSRLVRWAAVEAVQRVPAHTQLGAVREQVGAPRPQHRRGRGRPAADRAGLLRAARRTHPPPSPTAANAGGVSHVRDVVGAGRGSHDPRTRRGRPS